MSCFENAIEPTLLREGHFSDDAADHGGTTKYGISLRFLKLRTEDLDLDGWPDGDINHDGKIDRADILAMDLDRAKWFYLRHFWLEVYAAIRVQQIANKIFDIAVNAGPGIAHRVAQRALRAHKPKVAIDGAFGKKTLAAVNTASSRVLLAAMRSEQAGFYRCIITRDRSQRKWENGWMRRAYDE